jgi:hypothetical protein
VQLISTSADFLALETILQSNRLLNAMSIARRNRPRIENHGVRCVERTQNEAAALNNAERAVDRA